MGGSQPGLTYRPFLDGLRAIAVGGVIVYHLDRSWLPGGYLGVDLFFVLSGYLITTLLLAERRTTGRIDLPAFWARRVRRLFPALLLVLGTVSVGVAVDALGSPAQRTQTGGDLLSTLFYAANWRFIATDQSYFAQYVDPSPVRHAWSLAIEEQFYLAWPLVVGVVLARGGRGWLAATAAMLGMASVAAMWLLFDGSADPSRAYFGTDSRIWQILLGALLAIMLTAAHRERVVRAARPLALPALAVLLVAMATLADDAAVYYHGGALAVALATAALIAGLEGGGLGAGWLSWRPPVAIGLVSYGLYLWHFPVILWVQHGLGSTTQLLPALVAVVLTGSASALSYHLVERPIRRGTAIGGLRLSPGRVLRSLPVASAAMAAVILLSTGSAEPLPAWAGGSSSESPATTSPRASPGAEGSLIIGVIGDSVMLSAVPGLEEEAARRGWELLKAAFAGCPVGYEPLYDAEGRPSTFNQHCEKVRAAHDGVTEGNPQVVIWHDLQSVLSRRSPSGELLVAGTDAWAADLLSEWRLVLQRLTDGGAQVVIVMPPLRSQDVPGCAGSVRPERCAEVQAQDQLMRVVTERFWAQVADQPRVHLIEVDDLLCPAGLPCPARIDGIAVRLGDWDQTHFSPEGAEWFAPRLLDRALQAAGLGSSVAPTATP